MSKIITPQIPQWVLPVLEREGLRLCQNPTHEQLNIFRQKVEDYYQGEKRPGMFVYDLFVLVFKIHLDTMPNLPPLSSEQHVALYSKLIRSCLDLACTWSNDVAQQMQEAGKARSFEEFINSFNAPLQNKPVEATHNANRAK